MPNYVGVVQVSDRETAEVSSAALQLSAVRALLERERRETEIDILLVTALEILREGPKTTEQILKAHRESWVGVEVARERLVAALRAGEAAGYVIRTPSLLDDGEDEWTTTGSGWTELERAGIWADGTVAAFRDEVRQRASEVLVEEEERVDADAMADLIWEALCVGIKSGMAVFSGRVEATHDAMLVPSEFDGDAAKAYVYERCTNQERADLVWALVEDAIDQSIQFGNELVSYVCVGYILHGFLARRDLISAQKAAGSLDGVRIIVETPWLLSVAGSPSGEKIFAEVVARSSECGVKVLVPKHSIEELNEVIERTGKEIRQYENDLAADRVNIEVLLAVAGADNPLIRNWLERVRDTGQLSWDRFEIKAREFIASMEHLGIEVKTHEFPSDQRVSEAAALLEDELKNARSKKGRGKEQILRDAKTITMAWHRRSQSDAYRKGVWPSAWIVTRDNYMNKVYERLNPSDKRALAISPSQWLGILAVNAPVAEEAKLAQAAADYLTRQASLRIAVQWPPEVILEMAKAVTADTGVTSTEVRMQQQSLDDLLREQPELLEDPKAAAHTFAANILSGRHSRTEKVQRRRAALLQQKVAETEQKLVALEQSQHALVKGLEEKIGTLAHKEDELRQKEAEIEKLRVQGRRQTTAGSVFVVGVFAAWMFFYMGLVWLAIGTVISSVAFLVKARIWWSDPEMTWTGLLWALCGELPSLAEFFRN